MEILVVWVILYYEFLVLIMLALLSLTLMAFAFMTLALLTLALTALALVTKEQIHNYISAPCCDAGAHDVGSYDYKLKFFKNVSKKGKFCSKKG